MTPIRIAAVAFTLLLTAGCVNQTVKSTSVPPINTPEVAVAEDRLLDVGIVVFDPGLDDYDEDQQIYPEVRKAEAHFIPQQLAQAIQESGAWGAVRVIPSKRQLTDLSIEGRIINSSGEELEIHVTATDSRGVVWLDRDYSGKASRYAYESSTRTQSDPFQAIYNTVANDLLQSLDTVPLDVREEVRLVTELRFARSFSEEAFAGYLGESRKGSIMILRLPAESDPMLERGRSIRERDHMFIDTMQEYYGAFSLEMLDPYQEWRKLSYEEAIALQELQADARRRLIAGGVAILAGVAGAGSNDRSGRAAANVAIIGGGYLLKSGLEKRSEAQIYVQALEELGMSLEAEITPQVIELEDRTVMLSGNVEDQYDQWRELLTEIYRAEIGELTPPEEEQIETVADTL
jgi:hypothetical protein